MRAVAWTDVVQGMFLLTGCACILVMLTGTEGGLTQAAVEIERSAPEKLAVPDAHGIRTWVSNLLLLGFGIAVYPHAIQRIFAASSLPVLRRTLAVMAFMPLVTTLLAFLIGYVGLSRFPGLDAAESDKITIYVLSSLGTSTLVRWVIILMLTAVVAAIMSTADSALLSLGSMFTKDIYSVYLKPGQSAEHYLRVGKWFAWGLMAVLILFAYASLKTESSIWLLIKLKLEFMVQIVPVFVLGIFWRRLSANAAFAGMALGAAFTLIVWVGVMFDLWHSRSPWGVSAGVWGLLLNFGVCAGATALAPKQENTPASA
jgi:Na+/proline symporter